MRTATISLMAQRETASSPLAEALARVGDRWTLLVVEALLAGPQRFNDLAGHADPAQAPVHPACGTPVEARWYCPTCDRLVDDEPQHSDVHYI